MRDVLIAALVAALALLAGPPDDREQLTEAVKRYEQGLLSEAVVSLDALIRDAVGRPEAKPILIRAYVYRGAALVGLQ